MNPKHGPSERNVQTRGVQNALPKNHHSGVTQRKREKLAHPQSPLG